MTCKWQQNLYYKHNVLTYHIGVTSFSTVRTHSGQACHMSDNSNIPQCPSGYTCISSSFRHYFIQMHGNYSPSLPQHHYI